MAADLYTPAPEPAVSTWTGFWVGAGVGYGFANHELGGEAFIDNEDFLLAGKADLSGIGGEGWLGQIGGGYDFQLGDKFLVGIFGDYTFSDIKSSVSVDGFGGIDGLGGGGLAANYKLTADSMWFVGGRAGMLVNPDTLIYGLFGYSQVNFEGKFNYDFCPPEGGCGDTYKYDWDQGGLTFGGGMETKITEAITGKIEYRYIDLDKENIFKSGELGPDNEGINLWTDTNIQTVTASISYRFWTGPGY